MAKTSGGHGETGARNQGTGKKAPAGTWSEGRSGTTRGVARKAAVAVYETRVEAVMAAAGRSGLLQEKSGRIGGRVSSVLVERAKARTGIQTDTDLIAFALANIALDDKFPEAFKTAKGSIDSDLDLGL